MITPVTAEDVDLDALFQVTVAGITDLTGDLVRPRWQPVVPKQPEPTVNWCAIGVLTQTTTGTPYIAADPNDATRVIYSRHERIEVLASFYGPKGQAYAGRLRDGISIPQNMEALEANEIGLTETGVIRAIPALLNQQWVRAYDLPLIFDRKVTRRYPIGRFALASGIHLIDDTFLDALIPIPIPPGSP